jgi:hypothetical protein
MVNGHVSSEKVNTVASNFLSLSTSSPWIVSDVYFLLGITVTWLNPHFRWYQRPDAQLENSLPGHLAFHRAVRYFLMIEDLENIRNNWWTMEKFKKFVDEVKEMNEEQKKRKEHFLSSFIGMMINQVHKHNNSSKLFRTLYSEK